MIYGQFFPYIEITSDLVSISDQRALRTSDGWWPVDYG
jgi:hypothetical protein